MDEFKAHTLTPFQVLREPNVGLYIPAYQREYCWERTKITCLFKNVEHGLHVLVGDNINATTFIGTIIVIHDTKYSTVDPKIQGDLPKSVQVVIDGQQRLATFLLGNILLHEAMVKGARKLKKATEETDVWLYEQLLELHADLQKTFEWEVAYGDKECRMYPRMIRAYVDSWSRKKDQAKYSSPIAGCLRAYSQHFAAQQTKGFIYTPPTANADEAKKHNSVLAALKEIKRRRQMIASGTSEDEEMEMPSLTKIAQNVAAQEVLMRAKLRDQVVARLVMEDRESPDSVFCHYARLVFFCRFWLDRVSLVYVTAKSEDYAFDIFDALNTTGEPLTAVETFRPEIMKAEGLPDYENSPSRAPMSEVESVLDIYARAEQKRKATDEVLIHFALAETGHKLSKRLNEQRVWLRREYAKLDLAEKRLFVRQMADTAKFVAKAWSANRDPLSQPALYENATPERNLVMMCLEVLRKANHHVTVAPLVRFYSRIREAQHDTDRANAIAEFEQAVKAVTAFFALWRGSRRGTRNIDSHYRRLMRDGSPATAGFDSVEAFCREKAKGPPRAQDLKRALRQLLAASTEETKGEPAINSKQDWVVFAANLPVYEVSVPLSRLLLFAASHDTCPDTAVPGLVIAAKRGTSPILTWEEWNHGYTVEHVWPKSRPRHGWHPSLPDSQPDVVNRLGNLALLPSSENSSLGDQAWDLKRLAFQILSSESNQDLQARLSEAAQKGLVVPEGRDSKHPRQGQIPPEPPSNRHDLRRMDSGPAGTALEAHCGAGVGPA